MSTLAIVLAIACAGAGVPLISGHVLDEAGTPVAGARVFLEQGLGAPLVETASAQDGSFHFADVASGVSGVFATAPGKAFGGRSVHVALAEAVRDVDIRLGEPGIVTGRVVDAGGKPVTNARITRVALLGAAKVGVPLAKLKSLGFREPATDAEGRFTIDALPRGMKIALKVAHPRFAQAGATGIAVGDKEVEITLSRGVLVTGSVLSRGEAVPVANATILLRNVEPPRDTTVTRSGATGDFAARLRPGLYLYQALGAGYSSPGWQRLPVTGEVLTQRVTLYVAGTGTIKGKVMDARSGDPLQGARIVLEVLGAPADLARTGPTGAFQFTAAEGESIVRYDFAPGYIAPPHPAFTVRAAEGEVVEIPTFWVAPIPKYVLHVVDEEENPVPGAIVRVLRPPQFGWRATDGDGRVELAFATLPSDATVVGTAEHLSRPTGALFAIKRAHAADAVVQLMPLARVEGTVVTETGAGLEGAVVDARFRDESIPERLVLWRTLSGKGGIFSWDSVTPFVPQYCVVHAVNKKSGEGARGESASFLADSSGATDLGPITVTGGKRNKTALGDRLRWYENPALCGVQDGAEAFQGRPALVIYCAPDEAEMVIEGLAVARELLAGRELSLAAVVDGTVDCPTGTIPVFRGAAPGPATTYLIDGKGKVVLETFGMPPLRALNALAPAALGP